MRKKLFSQTSEKEMSMAMSKRLIQGFNFDLILCIKSLRTLLRLTFICSPVHSSNLPVCSILSVFSPEPEGQNHLSAREEGQPDTLQPLEQWISTVPCLRTITSSLNALHTFTLLQCQTETCHSTCGLLHAPKVPHTVTLHKVLNVFAVFFVFPPCGIYVLVL